MVDPARRALTEVQRQREAMARRVRLPAWFQLLFFLGWTTLLASPLLVRDHEMLGIPNFPYHLVAVVALLVLLVDFRRRSGLNLVVRSRQYPALRQQGVPTTAVLIGGAVIVWGLTLFGPPLPVLAAAVLAGGLAAVQVSRVNAAIRLDVLAGR